MLYLVLLIALAAPANAQSLADRIAHKDPLRYRVSKSVHGGPEHLEYMELLGPRALTTNLFFFHRGIIAPKGGIGHHFHHQMEEMFVIFDNEAEFTIDGRTSLLKAPAGAPCRLGHSHAIYNPTDRPVEWMNIAITAVKGRYDAFDLGDGRVGVALDPVPVFSTLRLDKSRLRPVQAMEGGRGAALYRRALPPEVFTTNWSYVDHLVVPAAASVGKHRHRGVEEIYYVLNGEGTFFVDNEKATVKKDDAVPVRFNEVHSIENNGPGDLEFMIFGIALVKGQLD